MSLITINRVVTQISNTNDLYLPVLSHQTPTYPNHCCLIFPQAILGKIAAQLKISQQDLDNYSYNVHYIIINNKLLVTIEKSIEKNTLSFKPWGNTPQMLDRALNFYIDKTLPKNLNISSTANILILDHFPYITKSTEYDNVLVELPNHLNRFVLWIETN